MYYVQMLFWFSFLLWVAAVASNPGPNFAALALVVATVICSFMLALWGLFYLPLVSIMIYLGGMLVVFAYSVALVAEPFPESWGGRSVAFHFLGYFLLVILWLWAASSSLEFFGALENQEFPVLRSESDGVSVIYYSGGSMLIVSGWVLLLTLFVVLELTRGLSRGTLRAV